MKKGMCFVPIEYRHAIDAVSKGHLADLAWDLAGRLAEQGADHLESVFSVIRDHSDRVAFERAEPSIGRAFDRREQSINRDERRMQMPERQS